MREARGEPVSQIRGPSAEFPLTTGVFPDLPALGGLSIPFPVWLGPGGCVKHSGGWIQRGLAGKGITVVSKQWDLLWQPWLLQEHRVSDSLRD